MASIIALTIGKYKYILFYSHKRVVSPLLDKCTFSNLLLVTLLPLFLSTTGQRFRDTYAYFYYFSRQYIKQSKSLMTNYMYKNDIDIVASHLWKRGKESIVCTKLDLFLI